MEKAPAVQLTFQLRTSINVRSVHLLGSWDNYKRQLPLSAIKDTSAKPGSWRGTFRFQGSQALKLGSRYWYYYIVDGFHVSHDPAKEFVTEKTTGQKLNILDVPGAPAKTSKPVTKPGLSVQTQNLPSSRHSRGVVQGRSLSPTRIQCPRPQKPYASRQLREADYEVSPIEDLEIRFASSRISERSRNYNSSPSDFSDCSSSGPEFSEPSSAGSGFSRVRANPACRCGRYGVTRDGKRVPLDCGGSKCSNYSDSSSDCTSSSDSDSEEERLRERRRLKAVLRKNAGLAVPAVSNSSNRRKAVIIERRP